MSKKDIVIARCPGHTMGDKMEQFHRVIREQLPPSEYIVFIDATSQNFDIELVTKPIVINSEDDLDEQLEKLNSLIKELRDGDLNKI